jgi:hypothetical protein
MRSFVVHQEKGISNGLAMQIDPEWSVTAWKVRADRAGGCLGSGPRIWEIGM